MSISEVLSGNSSRRAGPLARALNRAAALGPGGSVRLGVLGEAGGRVDLGEGGEQSDDRGVLDEEVGELSQLRGEAVAGCGPKLGEAIGDALAEELDELGSESVVKPPGAQDRVRGPLVVGISEGFDGALELGSRFEGEGVEKGNRVELTVPSDEAGLSGDPLNDLGWEERDERLEIVVSLGASDPSSAAMLGSGLPDGCAIPSRWLSPHEPTRFQWKAPLTENT